MARDSSRERPAERKTKGTVGAALAKIYQPDLAADARFDQLLQQLQGVKGTNGGSAQGTA